MPHGHAVVTLTNEIVPRGTRYVSKTSCTRPCRHWLLCNASLPPFRIRELPVAMARPATYTKHKLNSQHSRCNVLLLCQWELHTRFLHVCCIQQLPLSYMHPLTCTRQSGRDSNTTRTTPNGTLLRTSSSPSPTFILSTSSPTMSHKATPSIVMSELINEKLEPEGHTCQLVKTLSQRGQHLGRQSEPGLERR